MPSADLGAAAAVATTARCQNNGQSCIAAKRFIVHEAVAPEFEERFVHNMMSLKVGDPFDETTDVGPLATSSGLDEVDELVSDAVSTGAEVLCGGERVAGPGWFYPPTVVTGITEKSRMYTEEVFGPVAGLFRVGSIGEAVELANVTEFGLGANAWTNLQDEQAIFIRDLEAGAVFINGMVTSYPELPFGGVKASGYGRELSAQGIRAFCNLKTVWVGGAA
jgi:succinate-semialdehyde dehydrogenase/glutarate-semialdehyde dehydrogenase